MVYNTYVKIDTISKVKEFSDTMSHFKEPIYLESGSYVADAKSILGIMVRIRQEPELLLLVCLISIEIIFRHMICFLNIGKRRR